MVDIVCISGGNYVNCNILRQMVTIKHSWTITFVWNVLSKNNYLLIVVYLSGITIRGARVV